MRGITTEHIEDECCVVRQQDMNNRGKGEISSVLRSGTIGG